MPPRPQTQLQPLIPSSILISNVNMQAQSTLFTKLPTEILHRILLLAIERPTTNQPPEAITRVFMTLTSKLLASQLASASSTLPNNTRGMSANGIRLKNDIPRNVYTKNAPTAHQTARIQFMDKIGLWLRPEDGWALCAICLAYKQIEGGGLGAEKGSWRSMKRALGDIMRRVMVDTMSTLRDFVGAAGPAGDVDGKADGVKIKVEDDEEDDIGLGGGDPLKHGWMKMEEHLICPKHRFTGLQMLQLRDQ